MSWGWNPSSLVTRVDNLTLSTLGSWIDGDVDCIGNTGEILSVRLAFLGVWSLAGTCLMGEADFGSMATLGSAAEPPEPALMKNWATPFRSDGEWGVFAFFLPIFEK